MPVLREVFLKNVSLTTPIGLFCKDVYLVKIKRNSNKYIKKTLITTAFWILFTVQYIIFTFGSADVASSSHYLYKSKPDVKGVLKQFQCLRAKVVQLLTISWPLPSKQIWWKDADWDSSSSIGSSEAPSTQQAQLDKLTLQEHMCRCTEHQSSTYFRTIFIYLFIYFSL